MIVNLKNLQKVGVAVPITLAQVQAVYRYARKHGFKVMIRTLPDGMKAWRVK